MVNAEKGGGREGTWSTAKSMFSIGGRVKGRPSLGSGGDLESKPAGVSGGGGSAGEADGCIALADPF